MIKKTLSILCFATKCKPKEHFSIHKMKEGVGTWRCFEDEFINQAHNCVNLHNLKNEGM
jgi:hypothetical protein